MKENDMLPNSRGFETMSAIDVGLVKEVLTFRETF